MKMWEGGSMKTGCVDGCGDGRMMDMQVKYWVWGGMERGARHDKERVCG